MKKALWVVGAFFAASGAILLLLGAVVVAFIGLIGGGFLLESYWRIPMPFGSVLLVVVGGIVWAGLLAAWDEAKS